MAACERGASSVKSSVYWSSDSELLPKEIVAMSFRKFMLAGCLSVFCACFFAGCASESMDTPADGEVEVEETVVEEANTTTPE